MRKFNNISSFTNATHINPNNCTDRMLRDMHACPTQKATNSDVFPDSEYIWIVLSVLPHTLLGI